VARPRCAQERGPDRQWPGPSSIRLAERAAELACDRQAKGGLPALDALPAVVEVADGLPVVFDSGVRTGAAFIKALALGATAACVGRPYAYGLASTGWTAPLTSCAPCLPKPLIVAVDGYPALADRAPDALRRIR
jgi:lactate 2-monooxygenase